MINSLKDDFNTVEALDALFDLITTMNVGFSQVKQKMIAGYMYLNYNIDIPLSLTAHARCINL